MSSSDFKFPYEDKYPLKTYIAEMLKAEHYRSIFEWYKGKSIILAGLSAAGCIASLADTHAFFEFMRGTTWVVFIASIVAIFHFRSRENETSKEIFKLSQKLASEGYNVLSEKLNFFDPTRPNFKGKFLIFKADAQASEPIILDPFADNSYEVRSD